ncbi:hypothetical protein [Streptomyces sp. LaPpAH-108]|uniref:hypothetical protein n=1 Tax=Streptomyces sp. LaPpAH-108 TaxID=1155714 RepID=UPI00037D32F4|nr:hypothetical protein [Streptomyces sp. LaPpAH-108]
MSGLSLEKKRTVSIPAARKAPAEPIQQTEPVPAASRFDTLAEEILSDSLTGPLAPIAEAIRDGRTTQAASLASRTIAHAARVLGPRHPEVLTLGELTAYIAYLTGDVRHACELSLNLAYRHRESTDPTAAYANVLSASTAWRAIPDPSVALPLGHTLTTLWTLLTTEPGPASTDDPHLLESARGRLPRLAARARSAGGPA